jgi:hypothetical protein
LLEIEFICWHTSIRDTRTQRDGRKEFFFVFHFFTSSITSAEIAEFQEPPAGELDAVVRDDAVGNPKVMDDIGEE